MTYFNPFTITHQPSGDEAEAETFDAAVVAGATLIQDNDGTGTCRIWENGRVRSILFPPLAEPHVMDSRDFAAETEASDAYEKLRRLDNTELRMEAHFHGINPLGMGRQQIIGCIIDKELGGESS